MKLSEFIRGAAHRPLEHVEVLRILVERGIECAALAHDERVIALGIVLRTLGHSLGAWALFDVMVHLQPLRTHRPLQGGRNSIWDN